MKLKTTGKAFVLITACGLGALYGAATVHFQLSPYPQLMSIKKRLSSNVEPRSSYYADRKDFFEAHGKPADIVMIGDSITDRAEWVELLGVVNVANRGINSDTTDGVIERMTSIYSTNAKKAFIMIGINDIAKGKTPETIFENYKIIIKGLSENNITPHIQSTLLAGRSEEQYNTSVNTLNSMLKKYAKEHGVVFIDLNEILTTGGVLNASYTTDDIHLNGNGYTAWSKAIEQYIRSSDATL